MALSNWLTDEQLKTLLKRYFDGGFSEEDKFVEESKAWNQRIQGELLNIEIFDSLPLDEFLKRAEEIYRKVVTVPMFYKTFANHPEEIHAAFRYLLHSEDDLGKKVSAVLDKDGPHRIGGLGISYWSVIIRAMDPENYARWTQKTEKALSDLGMDYWQKGDTAGEKYLAITKASLALRDLADYPEADLYTIDHFMHYVTVLEGKEILDQWKNPESPNDDPWKNKIAAWQNSTLLPERIEARKISEDLARYLLESNLGEFDEAKLRQLFAYINSDYWSEKSTRTRFSPYFVGKVTKEIVEQMRILFFGFGLAFGKEFAALKELAGGDESPLKLYQSFRDPQSAFDVSSKQYNFMSIGPVSPLSFSGSPLFFTSFNSPQEFFNSNRIADTSRPKHNSP